MTPNPHNYIDLVTAAVHTGMAVPQSHAPKQREPDIDDVMLAVMRELPRIFAGLLASDIPVHDWGVIRAAAKRESGRLTALRLVAEYVYTHDETMLREFVDAAEAYLFTLRRGGGR